MSLFVAVVPPHEAVEDLADALHGLRHQPVASAVHWHPAERWHVTMCFLGDPDESADDEVGDAMQEIAQSTSAPIVQLSGAGVFGRQVLWVGASGIDQTESAGFADLAARITRSARSVGLTVEKRPWRPHLTIGRTRGSDARPVAPLLAMYSGPSWPISELLTVRSQGGPHPVHTVVHRAPLAG